jgi:hypothetical protein
VPTALLGGRRPPGHTLVLSARGVRDVLAIDPAGTAACRVQRVVPAGSDDNGTTRQAPTGR